MEELSSWAVKHLLIAAIMRRESCRSFFTLFVAVLLQAALATSYNPWPYLQTYPPWNDSRTPLHFAVTLSFGGGYTSIGALPGVQIALDYINSHPSILPGYTLHYTLTDSQVYRKLQLYVQPWSIASIYIVMDSMHWCICILRETGDKIGTETCLKYERTIIILQEVLNFLTWYTTPYETISVCQVSCLDVLLLVSYAWYSGRRSGRWTIYKIVNTFSCIKLCHL